MKLFDKLNEYLKRRADERRAEERREKDKSTLRQMFWAVGDVGKKHKIVAIHIHPRLYPILLTMTMGIMVRRVHVKKGRISICDLKYLLDYNEEADLLLNSAMSEGAYCIVTKGMKQ